MSDRRETLEFEVTPELLDDDITKVIGSEHVVHLRQPEVPLAGSVLDEDGVLEAEAFGFWLLHGHRVQAMMSLMAVGLAVLSFVLAFR